MKLLWRARRRVALTAVSATLAALAGAPAAMAYVTTDMNNWNLTDQASTYGNGSVNFNISSGSDGHVSFRWLDSPNKTTVISGNTCGDYALLHDPISIGSADTTYHEVFAGGTSQCFVLRGRTAIGSGSMVSHDGRVQR